MTATVIKIHQQSLTQLECSACGATADLPCNCGATYVPARDKAAKAVAINPEKSDRAIAAEVGVARATVQRARNSGGSFEPPERNSGASDDAPEKRLGRDGKRYSVKQRIVDTPGISQKMANDAAATNRRRIFFRCAADSVRKAEQGAGLKDARGPEIDNEILAAFEDVIQAWTTLRDEMLNRKETGK